MKSFCISATIKTVNISRDPLETFEGQLATSCGYGYIADGKPLLHNYFFLLSRVPAWVLLPAIFYLFVWVLYNLQSTQTYLCFLQCFTLFPSFKKVLQLSLAFPRYFAMPHISTALFSAWRKIGTNWCFFIITSFPTIISAFQNLPVSL